MSNCFEKVVRPLLFRLDAEKAHELGLAALRSGIGWNGAKRLAQEADVREEFGMIERFGLKFSNPLGIAAGFDKNGSVVNGLAALGFGSVEVGTVTYDPQAGNPKPRLFRLERDRALINRLGFNNGGAREIARRLVKVQRQCVVGVNIGRNRDVSNEDAVENYLKAFTEVHPVADYVAVNISSPNTPGLRSLQSADNLERLLKALQDRNRLLGPKPILVKIAPDLDGAEIEAIVDISKGCEVSGIIATNTTVTRAGLGDDTARSEPGGLSGRPLAKLSNMVISRIYNYSKGTMPIIGVGGIFTPEDAFVKVAAGACLLQAYTGFVYTGPSFPFDINLGLAHLLKQKGFRNLDDAVGSGSERRRTSV